MPDQSSGTYGETVITVNGDSYDAVMEPTSDVHRLVALGLTQYEARCYLGLISREQVTPGELARLTGVPRQRVYDVLAGLVERGLARSVPDSASYRPQPPDVVVQRLLDVRSKELSRAAREGDELAARLMPRFQQGQSENGPLDYIEVLRDGKRAADRVEALVAAAEQEVIAMVRPPFVAPPPAQEAAVNPAIRQRGLYEKALFDTPELAELVRAYAALGEEVRITDHLPLKLTIVDGQTVAFNLPDPVAAPESVTVLVVHHRMLAQALCMTFDAVWASATPLGDWDTGAPADRHPLR